MTGVAAVFAIILALTSPPQSPASAPAAPPPVPAELRGIAIGAKIPVFQAIDQFGRIRVFDSLAGPKGLVLLFVRSADW